MLLNKTMMIVGCGLLVAYWLLAGVLYMLTRIWDWIVYAYRWLRFEEWKSKGGNDRK